MADRPRHPIPRKLFLLRGSDEYQRWVYRARSYPRLPEKLRDQLLHIEPTVRQDGACYWPVRATLRDGSVLDRACVMDAEAYMKSFARPWPELLADALSVSILEIEEFAPAPCRLPRRLVNKLQRSDEFKAGAAAYTLHLKNGGTIPIMAADGLLDFTCLPDGACADDIVDATPTVAGELAQMQKPERAAWCLANIEGPAD